MISDGTNTVTLMTNSVGESRHIGHSIIHFKSIVIMIAYAIYTIITLICIHSHICSVILRFSYFSIIYIFLYFFSCIYLLDHIFISYISSELSSSEGCLVAEKIKEKERKWEKRKAAGKTPA